MPTTLQIPTKALRASALLLCAFVGMIGCGPKVTSHLATGAALPAHIALLPANYSLDIPRQRIDLVRGQVVSALRNHNFIVADEKLVESLCSSASCPERSRLNSQYLVDAFATLTISSFSKNNFLAGYYNQLSGTLSFADKAGTQLLSADYTQSESGGLLFNSGQVLQGIISQVNNSGDAAYQELAAEFAQAVVEQLPAPVLTASSAKQEGLELAVQSASAQWQSPSSYTVCLKGTPHSFASLIIGGNQTTLREVSPGSYCSAFSALVASATNAPALVELRSAFGNSERKELLLPARSACALKDRLESFPGEVALRCALVGRDLSRLQVGCSDKLKPCAAEKLYLYTGKSEQGPFQKWSETSSASAKISAAPGPVQVMAIGSGGVPSLPVLISSKSLSVQ